MCCFAHSENKQSLFFFFFSIQQFTYPTRPDEKVFENFSLTFPAGKTTALVGASGCGKSSIMALLERFYDPSSGSVTLDGKDLRSLNIQWLRDQIAMVSQQPILFPTTIYQNIASGKDNATPEEVEAAARMSNAHNFIMQFPDGYNTLVGDQGAQLSGGQKQRIAVARYVCCCVCVCVCGCGCGCVCVCGVLVSVVWYGVVWYGFS